MPTLNRFLDALPPAVVRAVVHRLWPRQEPELARLDDYLIADCTAVDVGAWWGPWTAALARRCPRVHSFEPQPQLAARLREWAPSHVTVHEAGVGAQAGSARLTRPDSLPGTDGLASLRPSTGTDAVGWQRIEVDVVTLDGCGLTDVGFIKIDVEGLEQAVLVGAETIIGRDRPRLMIEIEQRHLDRPISEVFDWLIRRDYEGWFLRGGVRRSMWYRLDDFDVEADQLHHLDRVKSARYINAFLFVPAEQGWVGPV
ncbi:MAG: FkbM family methyltransferase [Acidimicrobiia bacterium]|nr:FkbM family methyltransferase [Acidimicrobiia bacterium]